MKEIIQLLGFLGALRNYGYIDRVGNAIDEVTIEEALRDAIRAYLTQCVEAGKKCIELGENIGITCPDINPESLEESIKMILKEIKKSKVELIKFSRSLALEAYASIPKIREEHTCIPEKG